MRHPPPNTIVAVILVSLVAAGMSLAALLARPHIAEAQVSQAQPRPQAVAPQWTPYQRDAFLFHNWQEAAQALDSPDILMRRSGVEWLGRWTATDGGSHTVMNGVDYEVESRKQLRGRSALVAGLTRAVREMPDRDSQQAARLLTLIGAPARPALPAVCATLDEQGSRDGFKRYEILSSLVRLCGGPNEVGSSLAALLQDPDPETRRAAAGAVGLCDDIGFEHISPPPSGAEVLSPSQGQTTTAAFRTVTISALAVAVEDRDSDVRLAALKSLEALTYNSADAPWQTALPPLSRLAASTDPRLRLASLRVLAYVPADISPFASSLRSGLHGGEDERDYAPAALSHAAQTDRVVTVSAFLTDLASSDLSKRRRAASDIRLAATPLWAGGFWPAPYPLQKWWNDSRLFMVSDPPGLTQTQREEEIRRRQAAAEKSQPLLLAALVKAASDPDHAVRTDATLSIEDIGKWTYAVLGHGGRFREAMPVRPQVAAALGKAADAVQADDAPLADRLHRLQARVTTSGPSAIF